MSKDFKRTQKLLSELSRRLSSLEELRFNKHVGSYFKFQGSLAMNVGRGLIGFLGVQDGSAKFLVEFV